VALAVLRQEVPGQQQDVAAALVKSRHLDGDDSQAEEQVPAEFALLDHLFQMAIGRADDPQVDLALLDRAHPAYGSVLKQLEQLACSPRSISPISPRNRVPPSAASTRPIRRSL